MGCREGCREGGREKDTTDRVQRVITNIVIKSLDLGGFPLSPPERDPH